MDGLVIVELVTRLRLGVYQTHHSLIQHTSFDRDLRGE